MSVSRWIVLAALSLPLSIPLAFAVTPTVDPDTLPLVACTDLHWNAKFLAQYPRAPAACQEARVYRGKRFAKFNARVFLVHPDAVTLTFLNVAGSDLSTFTYRPAPGAVVYVNGKPTEYSDLKVGDRITVWLSETRFSVSGAPGSVASPGLAPTN
jgi:hypothetical protein